VFSVGQGGPALLRLHLQPPLYVLFKTGSIDVVKDCQSYFAIDLPSCDLKIGLPTIGTDNTGRINRAAKARGVERRRRDDRGAVGAEGGRVGSGEGFLPPQWGRV